jgi:MFS family permease
MRYRMNTRSSINSDTPSAAASAASSSSLRPPLEWNLGGLALVFVTPMLGGFLYGYDIGATSFVLVMLLRDDTTSNDDTICWWWSENTISSVQQGLLVSALSLGALMGSHLVLMYLSSRIGRRMELRICATLYLFGTLLNVLSGTKWLNTNVCDDSSAIPHWAGFAVLLAGRLLFGMGVGFVMHGAPAYMAEMCPAEIRGAVVSAKETVIVGGIVVGYATGNWISSSAAAGSSSNHWTGTKSAEKKGGIRWLLRFSLIISYLNCSCICLFLTIRFVRGLHGGGTSHVPPDLLDSSQ